MTKLNDLIKIKSFLSAERQSIAALSAPDDFAAQLRKLAADYDLREQAAASPILATTDRTEKAPAAPPLRQARPRFYNRRPFISPALTAAVTVAALIICAIGLTLPGGGSLPQRFSGLVEIKAAYAATTGIDVREGFIISASQPLSAELVEKSLQVYPGFDYRIEEEDDSTYRVLPVEPLSQNTVYHLSFDPERVQEEQPVRAEYSWSFQTEADFAIIEVSPTDTAREVPAGASLTVTFNEQVAPEAADFISIEPQIDGTWQAGESSLYFLPAAGWAYDTVYTVRITEGLLSLDGSALGQGYLSRFHTEAPPAPQHTFSFALTEQNTAFLPQETPAWPLTTQEEDDGSPYVIELYALEDANVYAMALIGRGQGFDPAQLELWGEYEIIPGTGEDETLLELPTGLPAGFYAANISKQVCQRQVIFQVSGLNAYLAPLGEERLLWLHDGAGAPVAGARIWRWPQGLEQGITDGDGLAVLKNAGGPPEAPLYCIETAQEALVIPGFEEPPLLPQAGCFRYELYTDQAYYTPGQMVRFFGFCEQNPGGEQNPPLQLTVRLKGIGTDQQALPYSVSVEGGAFSGSLALPGLRDGWYELALYAQEKYLGGCYIQVGAREGHLYQLSLRPAVGLAQAGQPVEWLVQAGYYTDTPLPGIKVRVEDVQSGLVTQLETDAAGRAVLTLPAANGDGPAPLNRQELRATATFPVQGETSTSAFLPVLQYDTFIDAVVEPLLPGEYIIQITPYSLSLPESADMPQNEAIRGSFSGSMALTATLICHETEEIEAADAPQEPAGPLVLEEIALELFGGETLLHEVALPRPGSYGLRLSGTDGAGQAFVLELALPYWPDDAAAAPLALKDAYTARGEEHLYTGDEQVQLRLYRGETPWLPLDSGRVLFVLSGETLLAGQLSEDGSASFSFMEDYPAYIYGRAIYYADGRYIESEALPLFGKDTPAAYLTAEWQNTGEETSGTVRLSLRLTDADGQPLAAVLNLNLLDQTAAESALFVNLKTNADGLAELEFTPPATGQTWDLCWRAYAHERQLSASGQQELDLRQPFALLSRFEGPLAAGDAPVLRFCVGGTQIQPTDTVSYEISLPQLGFQYDISSEAGVWQEIALPELPAGEYQLMLIAESAPYQDTVFLPFTVRQSLNGGYTLHQQSLTDTLPPQGGEEEITLIFTDTGKAATLAALFALANADSVRLEQKLAALTAAQVLEQQFGWRGAEAAADNLLLYQRENGGLAPLPQAAADRKLSALAAPLVREKINRPALAAYLRSWYEQTEEEIEKALALYGLAGLDQPVLLDIEAMMARQPTQAARLYLALAYVACGNGAAAKEMAVELLADHSEQVAEGLMQAAGLAGADEAVLREATAYLALLANTFQLPQAEALYAGMLAHEQAGFSQLLAKAQILAARCRILPANGYFSYRLDGRRQQISLREHEYYSLKLSASALAGLSFSEVAGDVMLSVISYHTGLLPAAEAQAVGETEQPLPQIKRFYQRQETLPLIRERGLVEVRLDFSLPADAPAGYYRIDDTLPAGLRFCAMDTEATSRRLWLLAGNGLTVSFNVYKGKGAYQGSITYTARVQMPGGYSAEAPLLYAVRRPELSGRGQVQRVEIK